eukprot:1303708-Pyramimonas_sp.AAC.1
MTCDVQCGGHQRSVARAVQFRASSFDEQWASPRGGGALKKTMDCFAEASGAMAGGQSRPGPWADGLRNCAARYVPKRRCRVAASLALARAAKSQRGGGGSGGRAEHWPLDAQ